MTVEERIERAKSQLRDELLAEVTQEAADFFVSGVTFRETRGMTTRGEAYIRCTWGTPGKTKWRSVSPDGIIRDVAFVIKSILDESNARSSPR